MKNGVRPRYAGEICGVSLRYAGQLLGSVYAMQVKFGFVYARQGQFWVRVRLTGGIGVCLRYAGEIWGSVYSLMVKFGIRPRSADEYFLGSLYTPQVELGSVYGMQVNFWGLSTLHR